MFFDAFPRTSGAAEILIRGAMHIPPIFVMEFESFLKTNRMLLIYNCTPHDLNQAHHLKVGGSNPSPATNLFTINQYLSSPDGEFFCVGKRAESQISHMYFLDLQVFGHKT